MDLKKIITGVILCLLMITTISVIADSEPIKVTVFEGGYSHGGWTEFGSVIRMNKTAPIDVTSPPMFELNIWIWNRANEHTSQIGSPSFPNYTFTLRVFSAECYRVGMSSHRKIDLLYIRNVTADPIYSPIDDKGKLENDTAWMVRNETFTLQDSDFYEDPDDGWCYFIVTYEGIGFNTTTGLLGEQWESKFLGHIKDFFYYYPGYFAEVQVYDPFEGWPRPEDNGETSTSEIESIEPSTSEDTPFGYLFALAIAIMVIWRKKAQKHG